MICARERTIRSFLMDELIKLFFFQLNYIMRRNHDVDNIYPMITWATICYCLLLFVTVKKIIISLSPLLCLEVNSFFFHEKTSLESFSLAQMLASIISTWNMCCSRSILLYVYERFENTANSLMADSFFDNLSK